MQGRADVNDTKRPKLRTQLQTLGRALAPPSRLKPPENSGFTLHENKIKLLEQLATTKRCVREGKSSAEVVFKKQTHRSKRNLMESGRIL